MVALRRFVASLRDHLASLTPAELYVLFQQNGLLTNLRAGGRFARAVLAGAVPPAELEKFAAREPSQVDDLLAPEPRGGRPRHRPGQARPSSIPTPI